MHFHLRAFKCVSISEGVTRNAWRLPVTRHLRSPHPLRVRATEREVAPRHCRSFQEEMRMTEKKGHGSEAAKKANAKANQEGKSNPRTSSSAQAELGKKGGKSK
jgi:hypothetical protein